MIRLLTFFIAALVALSIVNPIPKGNQTQVRVRKRGIAYNIPAYVKYFNDPESKVFWIYNWDSTPGDVSMWYEYIPMLHSNKADQTGRWAGNVAKASHGRISPGASLDILSFNEPDQCANGGACMTDVDLTVQAHKQWVNPLVSTYASRLYIGSPTVTNGAYPMGLSYLDAFLKKCTGCKLDYVTIHWYDRATNIEYFKNHLTEAHNRFGKRVWITEFYPYGSVEEKIKSLQVVLPWMNAQHWIFRYAMYMAKPGFLINDAGTGLSRVGHFYNTYGEWREEE